MRRRRPTVRCSKPFGFIRDEWRADKEAEDVRSNRSQKIASSFEVSHIDSNVAERCVRVVDQHERVLVGGSSVEDGVDSEESGRAEPLVKRNPGAGANASAEGLAREKLRGAEKGFEFAEVG